jgi:hypothetical protein
MKFGWCYVWMAAIELYRRLVASFLGFSVINITTALKQDLYYFILGYHVDVSILRILILWLYLALPTDLAHILGC